jgi:hypothetical protein
MGFRDAFSRAVVLGAAAARSLNWLAAVVRTVMASHGVHSPLVRFSILALLRGVSSLLHRTSRTQPEITNTKPDLVLPCGAERDAGRMRKTAATPALLAPHRGRGRRADGRIAVGSYCAAERDRIPGLPNRAPSNRHARADEVRVASVSLMSVSAGREMVGRTNTARVLQGRRIACILADFVEKPTDNVR